MSDLKVAVVGHSNVPRDLDNIAGVNLKTFRVPGACVSDAYQGHLAEVFDFCPNLVVIYLGGNDIAFCDKRTLLNELINLINVY